MLLLAVFWGPILFIRRTLAAFRGSVLIVGSIDTAIQVFRGSILRILSALEVFWDAIYSSCYSSTGSISAVSTAHTASTRSTHHSQNTPSIFGI